MIQKVPKYERGFKFYTHSIVPIEIPKNTITLYKPLSITEYECKIEQIDIFGMEITYKVNIISGSQSCGKCIMKESIIDNIIHNSK